MTVLKAAQPDRYEAAKDWLIEQYALGYHPPLSQAVDTLGISRETIRKARRDLRDAGLIPPEDLTVQRARRNERFLKPATAKIKSTQALVRKVMRGEAEVLTPEQRKQLLSELIKVSPPMVAKSLMDTLERAESNTVTAESYAPPEPLTQLEAATRLSRLNRAYGETIAAAAFCIAFRPEILPPENEPDSVPADAAS